MLKTASSVINAIGALNYAGTWNANSNSPTLTSGVGTKGNYYVVSVAGTTTLDGINLWSVGDWAVFNGTAWQKVDGASSEAFSSITVTGLTGYMYANNTSPVTASLTIPNSGLANSTATLGNATITLGSTTSSVGNLTLNNVTIASGNSTITNENVSYINVSTAIRTQALTGYLYGNANTGNVSAATTIPNAGLANSTATLGNATITLGSATSTVGNLTLNNVTINSGNVTANLATSTSIPVANATGTLAVSNGGTGLTSLTAGYIPYGNGTSAFNNGSSLQYTSNGNGFSLAVASGGTWPEFSYQSSINLGNSGYGTYTARGGAVEIGSNFYVNSGAGISYKNSDYISYLDFSSGQFNFNTAPSGSGGTSATITTRMALSNAGLLTLGSATGQNGVFNTVIGSGGSNQGLVIVTSSTGTGWLGFNNGNNSSIPGQVTYNSNTNVMTFYSSGTIATNGIYSNTTANAANMYVDSSGNLYRSTSTEQYKTNIEPVEKQYSDNVLNLNPIWYRSTTDNPNWSWYGLSAEDTAKKEPRLVHWGYSKDSYEIITDENGAPQKILKDGSELIPDGIQYEKIVVLLLDVVKRLKADFEEYKLTHP